MMFSDQFMISSLHQRDIWAIKAKCRNECNQPVLILPCKRRKRRREVTDLRVPRDFRRILMNWMKNIKYIKHQVWCPPRTITTPQWGFHFSIVDLGQERIRKIKVTIRINIYKQWVNINRFKVNLLVNKISHQVFILIKCQNIGF